MSEEVLFARLFKGLIGGPCIKECWGNVQLKPAEHTGTLEISTPPEIAVGTYFHAWHGTKSTLVFSHTDVETFWSQPPRLAFLLSCGIVQPENTYFFIREVSQN